jgi:hypothetical protein
MAQDGCFSLAACHQWGATGMRTLSKVAKVIGIGAATSTAMDTPTNDLHYQSACQCTRSSHVGGGVAAMVVSRMIFMMVVW